MKAVDQFRHLKEEERFKGWPVVKQPQIGVKIPFFGSTINYQLETGNGVEDYTSIIRSFGWAVVFGVTETDVGPQVATLCQWKPGVNQASWELPPGGIGKIDPGASVSEIQEATARAYLKETGLGKGALTYLGHVLIETGKYRGAGPDDHGLPAHLFLATNLEREQDARQPEANEIIKTIMVPLEQWPEVLDSDLFTETSAVACAYKALVKMNILHF